MNGVASHLLDLCTWDHATTGVFADVQLLFRLLVCNEQNYSAECMISKFQVSTYFDEGAEHAKVLPTKV